MNQTLQRIALVTGANRGIGFEICRQLADRGLKVILTSRDEVKGKKAAEELRNDALDVTFYPLDVTRPQSIEAALDYVRREFGRLDVLINNAGVMLEAPRDQANSWNLELTTAFKTPIDILRTSMETNAYGPFRLCQLLIPLMQKNEYGRVVNVSSGMGQLAEMGGGWAGYRMSKAALNAVTRIYASETQDTNVLVNSASPGWVKTAMGGFDAESSVQDGADTIVWLATLPDGGPSGEFFEDRNPVDW